MLGDSDVAATIAVGDMEKATKFYCEVLGLKADDGGEGGTIFRSGNSVVFVYPSEFAGTNKATSASWMYEDLDRLVEDLKSKGITFEEYDNLPGVEREGVIHKMGDLSAVWFKDPDGNILNVVNSM